MPPPPAPTVIAPAARLTQSAEIDLAVSRPEGLRSDQEYLVRVYVNDEAVRERPLPRAEQFRIENVPLQQGDNDIRAALVGAGGEGQRSAAVAITRDDIAPDISIISPESDEQIHTAEHLLTGRTEAGADMSITSGRSGNPIPTSVDASGRFEALLELTSGQNPLTLRSEDAAGNVSQTRIVLVRADSTASLVLTISPTEVDAAALPSQLEIMATVHDEHGQPIDDALVTFGLSPPSLATTTHHARTSGGVATWQGRGHPGVGQLKRYLARHRPGDSFVGRRATSGRVAYRELSGGVSPGAGDPNRPSTTTSGVPVQHARCSSPVSGSRFRSSAQ